MNNTCQSIELYSAASSCSFKRLLWIFQLLRTCMHQVAKRFLDFYIRDVYFFLMIIVMNVTVFSQRINVLYHKHLLCYQNVDTHSIVRRLPHLNGAGSEGNELSFRLQFSGALFAWAFCQNILVFYRSFTYHGSLQ